MVSSSSSPSVVLSVVSSSSQGTKENNNNSLEEVKWNFMKEYSGVAVFLGVAYGCIAVCGCLGNSLVVLVVLRKRCMQTITNLFILNLALSDLLMSVIGTPMTPVAFFMEQWHLPEFFCQLLPMTMALCVYVSSWTSIAIASDRYTIIVYPFRARMSKVQCYAIIALVWFVASLVSCPYAVQHQYYFNTTDNSSRCVELWTSPLTKRIFDLSSFVLQFVIPVLLIGFCYARISSTLHRRHRIKASIALSNRSREEAELRRKRRTNRMLVLMVTIFILCWIPFNILIVVLDAMSFLFPANFPYSDLIFLLCHLTAMSSVVYNPFLYGWMNENFRREFNAVLPCLFTVRKSHGTAVMEEEEHLPNNHCEGFSPDETGDQAAVPLRERQSPVPVTVDCIYSDLVTVNHNAHSSVDCIIAD